MSRLTLEKTMKTSFVDIGDTSSDAPFHEYNERIGRLAENGRLSEQDIRELIASGRDVSETIDQVASTALSEVLIEEGDRLFLPGYTAVIADEDGELLGVQEKPNDIPKLKSYGPSLMWAMRKIGHERYATSRTGCSASERSGYVAVSKALTGKPFEDVPYGERHHIGGASIEVKNADERSSTRVHAGVSGVVATPEFREWAYADQRTRRIADEAGRHLRTWLDGFYGNMFAGSLDSTLGALILEEVDGYDTKGLFTETALMSIARRHAGGINVH